MVLDALRNLLHRQRKVWEMTFVLGGEAALEAFERAPFDVIVTDMRMPGMDGAELLTAVRDRFPSAGRIALSGHAERDVMKTALSVAHQFLSKPCDADVLKLAVERVCGLHGFLEDPVLRDVVGRLDALPSVPQVYLDLNAALDRASCSVATIAAIVERDPAMSAKVLQLVNSSYFGLARPLVSVAEAVSHLGSDLLRSLALSAHVFTRMAAKPLPGFSLDQLQSRAILGAKLARASLAADKPRADEAFTAALVRDIGMLVLAIGMRDRYGEVLAEVAASQDPLPVVERRMLGVTHAQVGAYLLGIWGLPPSIVEAVAYHHDPELIRHDDRAVALAVHAADLAAEAEA